MNLQTQFIWNSRNVQNISFYFVFDGNYNVAHLMTIWDFPLVVLTLVVPSSLLNSISTSPFLGWKHGKVDNFLSLSPKKKSNHKQVLM
jgi:hypothetical protein